MLPTEFCGSVERKSEDENRADFEQTALRLHALHPLQKVRFVLYIYSYPTRFVRQTVCVQRLRMEANPLLVLLLHHLARDVHLSRRDFRDARVRCRGIRADVVQRLVYRSRTSLSPTLAPQTHVQLTRRRNAVGIHFPRFCANPPRGGDGALVLHDRRQRLRRHPQPGAVRRVDDLLHLELAALGDGGSLRDGERRRLAEACASDRRAEPTAVLDGDVGGVGLGGRSDGVEWLVDELVHEDYGKARE